MRYAFNFLNFQDSLSVNFDSIEISAESEDSFKNADYIVLVGAKPRGPGMDRKDLLSANGKLFKHQAKMIEKTCKSTAKILVVGNPCNTNALAILTGSSKIQPENVTALSRLDENRAIGMIANVLKVPVSWVKNVGIYGNHSKTMVVDVSQAFYVKGLKDGVHADDIQESRFLFF